MYANIMVKNYNVKKEISDKVINTDIWQLFLSDYSADSFLSVIIFIINIEKRYLGNLAKR